MVQGMLIDVDGTLVLSNDAHARSWVQAFATCGLEVPYERVRPLIGMGADKLIPTLMPDLTEKEGIGKTASQRRQEIFLTSELPHLKATPGARELIQRLARDGVRLVVATSAKKDELGALLKVADVADLLTEWTSADDIEESKPAPDVVEQGMTKLALPKAEVLMLGDTPYDVEAAGKAGIGTIALRCGGWHDQDLGGALAIYDDPAGLLRHYARCPITLKRPD